MYASLWKCRESSIIILWRELLCQVWSNQNKHNENECGHNLVSVIHQVSDHQPHHNGSDWLPVLPHKLCQLPMVGVNNSMIICSKFQAKNYSENTSWEYVRRSQDVSWHPRGKTAEQNAYCILIQALHQACEHKLHSTLEWWMHSFHGNNSKDRTFSYFQRE
jgi:hypothetical protein